VRFPLLGEFQFEYLYRALVEALDVYCKIVNGIKFILVSSKTVRPSSLHASSLEEKPSAWTGSTLAVSVRVICTSAQLRRAHVLSILVAQTYVSIAD
jgi:hypothetical protein